ncbi:MAG: hypothetical protein MUF42_17375 [Cytophagaceae bacterium]|jgi:RHS repeat-associated protein|nr:hypothetical protein [Cytophagaceae bacterium]
MEDQGPLLYPNNISFQPMTCKSGDCRNNYAYDEIGNLIRDDKDEIESIEWTLYGKVKRVNRSGTSTKSNLVFYYDAMGRRTMKVEIPHNGKTDPARWKYTYYVNDASGNVMGIYSKQKAAASNEILTTLDELPMYGSSRIGSYKPGTLMAKAAIVSLTSPMGTVFGPLPGDIILSPNQVVGASEGRLVIPKGVQFTGSVTLVGTATLHILGTTAPHATVISENSSQVFVYPEAQLNLNNLVVKTSIFNYGILCVKNLSMSGGTIYLNDPMAWPPTPVGTTLTSANAIFADNPDLDYTAGTGQTLVIPAGFNFTKNITLTGTATLHILGNAAPASLVTSAGSTLHIWNNSSLSLAAASWDARGQITNRGTLQTTGNITLKNTGSTIDNRGTLSANNIMLSDAGTTLKNNGYLECANLLATSASNLIVQNTNRMVVKEKLNLASNTVFTNSYYLQTNTVEYLSSSATLNMTANAHLEAQELLLRGTLSGTGATAATVRVNISRWYTGATLSGKINYCDANGVETQEITPGASVVPNCEAVQAWPQAQALRYQSLPKQKTFELSDHLGNVRVLISNQKLGKDANADQRADYYVADVSFVTDYYAFGMTILNRRSGGSRYGFNGMEKDPENFEGAYEFGARIYDSRLGLFLSEDPTCLFI